MLKKDLKKVNLNKEKYFSKMQSKKLSIIEAITNTITGLIVSFGIQILIYPFLNIEVSLNQNIFITIVFFIASFLRSYIIRRIFTKIKTL